jgi:hypothetical protein
MFARRRQTKKLLQVARLLRELEAVAPSSALQRRPRPSRVKLLRA